MYAYNDTSQPVELGASIFVQVNHNLVNAVNEFNLSASGINRVRHYDGGLLGIWNGREFVFVQSASDTWWDTAKALWRYGLAPIKTVRLMKATVGKFLKMYEAPYFPFKSLSQVVYDLGLTAVTAATGEQYLNENGIGALFANEIIQASTRVNYAQNLPFIHGLEAMVCMATEGAMAVEGGNWQIFSSMINASGADVRLGTGVRKLEKLDNGSYVVHSEPTDDRLAASTDAPQAFDEVILAGPKQFSYIDFQPAPRHTPDEIPYVQLHVTLFTSGHLLQPEAFNLKPGERVPQIVLTTLPPDEQPRNSSAGVGSPGFYSISLLRETRGRRGQEYLYKIFSPSHVSDDFLGTILGSSAKDTVSWRYDKVWNSYPYELPRVTFEEIKLDDGLWYTSGIESFISTMETSSLMGMNVARLMVDEWTKKGLGDPTDGQA